MTQPPSQPALAPATRGRIGRILVGLIAAGLLLAGAFGIYYLFLRPEGPAPVGGATLAPVATASPTEAASDVAATADPATADPGDGTASGLDGVWTVDTSIGSFDDFSGTFVGYRVQEELAGIGAKVAVGRTPDVTGSLTLDGTTVTEATIEADLTALRSDDRNRDRQLGRQGIESDRFPTATFSITAPIELGSIPAAGEQIEVTASGQLTLHGVTRDVEVPMTAGLSGDAILVQGSIPILFADYEIEKPESFRVLSVDDNGIMEFQVYLSR
jgi:polyisoprenoid-binding protein YceI